MCAAVASRPTFTQPSVVPSNSGFHREFHQVSSSHNSHLMSVVQEIFNRILTPLYGSQDKAIGQIALSKDRVCHLLYEEDAPVGVLVFKTELSDEFEKECGLVKSVEIKSLFVDNSSSNSGKGLGSCLVDKLFKEVTALGLGHQSIHVTVSETKEESLQFFQKKGFRIVHAWKDRYIPGVTEYLLSCSAEVAAANGTGIEPRRTTSTLNRTRTTGDFDPQLVDIIHDAHSDDIHKLVRLPDGTFISGSKDNSIVKWSSDGSLIRIIDEAEPDMSQSEKNWVTDITVLNREYFLSGTRSGRIGLWKVNGDFVRHVLVKTPKAGSHISHHLNAKRVNCLAADLSQTAPSFFVGFPTMFTQFNLIENRTGCNTWVHGNDWVYSMHPLDSNRVLTVIACSVKLWAKDGENSWQCQQEVFAEPKRSRTPGVKPPQRPFISSLKPMIDSTDRFAISVFDGSVQIFDLTTSQILNKWEEHTRRVWSVLPLTSDRLASCGEDKTVRFWDARVSGGSTSVIGDFSGQVSAMERLDDQKLVVGTCVEHGSTGGANGAEIRFYDTRK